MHNSVLKNHRSICCLKPTSADAKSFRQLSLRFTAALNRLTLLYRIKSNFCIGPLALTPVYIQHVVANEGLKDNFDAD